MPKGKQTKEQARQYCLKHNRKIMWANEEGVWHSSTDLRNTPMWASQVIDAKTGVRYIRSADKWEALV